MKRSSFIQHSLLGLAGVASCSKSVEHNDNQSNALIEPIYRWKCITTWPPNFPVLGEGANLLAKWLKELSGGRIALKVFGGGELVPALSVFDEVMNGTVEMGVGVPYYWTGKHPAIPFFATIPFGMNAQQMNAWLYCGGGLELWKEVYAKFGIIPFPAGNTGVQMGGWFNKEILSVEDLKGLKMRIPGFGGKVLAKLGGTPVLSSGSEIYTNLETGVIDATEWIGPYHDYKMGFHKIAKYYYSPGWHEPGPNLEVMMNATTFNALPADIKAIVETACYRLNLWTLSEFEAKNMDYLNKILTESKAELKQFPKEVLNRLREATDETMEELVSDNALAKKVHDSYRSFQQKMSGWSELTEKLYHNDIS